MGRLMLLPFDRNMIAARDYYIYQNNLINRSLICLSKPYKHMRDLPYKTIRGFDLAIGEIPTTWEELLQFCADNGATLEDKALEAELVDLCLKQVFNHALASNLQNKLAKQLAEDLGLTIGKEDDKDFKDLSAMLKVHTLEKNFTLEQVQTALNDLGLMSSLKPRAERKTKVSRTALQSEFATNAIHGMIEQGITDHETIKLAMAGVASPETIQQILDQTT